MQAARNHGIKAMQDFAMNVAEFDLPNGLRAILAPTLCDSVVGVGVYYGAGIRSERPGQSGYAHLMEHIMFQGSNHVAPSAHAQHIQSNGGIFNASTHLDYVEYFQIVQPDTLDHTLFLEADRMAAPLISKDAVASQIDVVRDEILQNFVNRPYGGFPSIALRELLYEKFENRHDGHTDLSDLEDANPTRLAEFFNEHYRPRNAVLVITGGFETTRTVATVCDLFAEIRADQPSSTGCQPEPSLARDRCLTVSARQVPVPAIAIGYRIDSAVGDFDRRLAFVVVSKLLAGPRLSTQLNSASLAVDVRCYVAERAHPMSERAPTLFTIEIRHPAETSVEQVTAAVDAELSMLSMKGIDEQELNRAKRSLIVTHLRDMDSPRSRLMELGVAKLLHHETARAWLLTEGIERLTVHDVANVARLLRSSARGVVVLEQSPA